MKNKFQDTSPRLKSIDGLVIILFSVIVLLPGQSSLHALEAKTNCQVEYVRDRLMINAHNVALGQLLGIIREKTGIEFVIGAEQSEKSISIQLGALSPTEGLKKMLSNFNHALLFSPDNKLIKVIILDDIGSDNPPKAWDRDDHSIKSTVNQPSQSLIPEPFSRIMAVEPPPKEGMVVTYSRERMVVEPPSGEGMIVPGDTEKSKSKPR
jgi:hypothetical protein